MTEKTAMTFAALGFVLPFAAFFAYALFRRRRQQRDAAFIRAGRERLNFTLECAAQWGVYRLN